MKKKMKMMTVWRKKKKKNSEKMLSIRRNIGVSDSFHPENSITSTRENLIYPSLSSFAGILRFTQQS